MVWEMVRWGRFAESAESAGLSGLAGFAESDLQREIGQQRHYSQAVLDFGLARMIHMRVEIVLEHWWRKWERQEVELKGVAYGFPR